MITLPLDRRRANLHWSQRHVRDRVLSFCPPLVKMMTTHSLHHHRGNLQINASERVLPICPPLVKMKTTHPRDQNPKVNASEQVLPICPPLVKMKTTHPRDQNPQVNASERVLPICPPPLMTMITLVYNHWMVMMTLQCLNNKKMVLLWRPVHTLSLTLYKMILGVVLVSRFLFSIHMKLRGGGKRIGCLAVSLLFYQTSIMILCQRLHLPIHHQSSLSHQWQYFQVHLTVLFSHQFLHHSWCHTHNPGHHLIRYVVTYLSPPPQIVTCML
jgi:hypothetical protein